MVWISVIPDILFFGSYPHQHEIGRWIRDRGNLKRLSIVDLTTPEEREAYDLKTPSDPGVPLRIIRFPIEDHHTPHSVTEFISLLRMLASEIMTNNISTDHPMIIHCKGGHGRSPMVVAALMTMMNRQPVSDWINRITQLHHAAPGIHPKYLSRLCPVSTVQQEFLLAHFEKI